MNDNTITKVMPPHKLEGSYQQLSLICWYQSIRLQAFITHKTTHVHLHHHKNLKPPTGIGDSVISIMGMVSSSDRKVNRLFSEQATHSLKMCEQLSVLGWQWQGALLVPFTSSALKKFHLAWLHDNGKIRSIFQLDKLLAHSVTTLDKRFSVYTAKKKNSLFGIHNINTEILYQKIPVKWPE
jgi:hypothetical protein